MLVKYKALQKIICVLCILSIICISVPTPLACIVYAGTVSISLNKEACIYEKQDNIEFTVNYSQSGIIKVDVENYYGKKVYTNSWYASNAGFQTISLGNLDTGWYRIVFKRSTDAVSAEFVVTPSLSERYTGATPFSTDMAINSIVSDDTMATHYTTAAKYAGLNWVRERYSWWTKKDGKYDYSSFESAINKESEAGLNVIAVSTDYVQGGYSSQKEMFTDDLFTVYNYQKDMSAYFGDKVDVWEIWNETDHDNFGEIPADVYSSFFKAAAIAVKDSGSKSRVTFGGLCMYTDTTDFAPMMMKNDVMRYSDAYNIHRHLPVYGTDTQKFDTEFVKEHEALMLTGGYNRPLWVTEAGLAMPVVNDTNLKKQARYAVTSAIESLANGVDRHFWFVLPRFREGGNYEYGAFNEKGMPNPAYASLAIITKMLGVAEYKGKYNSSDFNGYVFNNGTNDVLVAWANTSQTLSVGQTYTAYNLMGNVISGTPSVSADPIYIVFNSSLDTSLYSKVVNTEPSMTADLMSNDRIVIQADFNGIEELSDVRDKGYYIGNVETRSVDVKVYNFNDTQVTGILNCNADGFRVEGGGKEIIIPAKGSVSAVVALTPDGVMEDTPQYVSFYVTTDEGNTSPTVAKVVTCKSIDIVPSKTAPTRVYSDAVSCTEQGLVFGSNDIKVDLSNPVSNPSNLAISDGTVAFSKQWQYIDYNINVKEAGSYYINFNRANAVSGQNFYIYARVNDETVNRRTGRTSNDDGSYTFQDEVQLLAGENTIRIGNMSAAGGTVSSVTLSKLDESQYTFSMNMSGGTRSFKEAYKQGIGTDPWLYIGDAVTAYPDGDNAPYVKFEVTIPKDGYYYPAVATAGANKVKLSVANKSFGLNDNSTVLSEQYVASGNSSAKCKWLQSNDVVYLAAGNYDVTLSLYSPTSAKWNTYIGAVRFIETLYNGDITIDLTTPKADNGAIVSDGVVTLASGQWVDYDVHISKDASYYVNFRRENSVSDKNFYIAVTANGDTVNRRTGRIQNSDGSYTFQDEIQLKEGNNTIRVAAMGANSGRVSNLSLIELENRQFTYSMNTAGGARTFKDAYKQEIGVDPWLWINDAVADYPEGDTAPYVTFEVTVPKSGYYYPAAAAAGANKVNLSIAGKSLGLNDDCTVLSESYKASGNSSAACSWLKSNQGICLKAGNYDVTLSLYGAAGEKWNTFIGAVRLIGYIPLTAGESSMTVPWAEYDVDVEETGTYRIRFASGGENRVKLMVNGSHISYKTGETNGKAYNGNYNSTWRSYENPVPLYKGKNTVRIELLSKGNDNVKDWDAVVSEILLVKVDDMPMTGITAKALSKPETNVEGLGFDPWAYINVSQEEAPYIKWNFEVPDTGYYKVRLAYGGSSKPKINIAGNSVSFENASKLGTYCLTGYISKGAPWYEARDVIYLEKGTYETKMEFIPGFLSSAGNWYLGFAGFQLAEVERAPARLRVSSEMRGENIVVNYQAPSGTDFDIIVAGFAAEDGIRRLKEVFDPVLVKGADEVGIKTIPVSESSGDEFEIYVWDSIAGMKPLLNNADNNNYIIRGQNE